MSDRILQIVDGILVLVASAYFVKKVLEARDEPEDHSLHQNVLTLRQKEITSNYDMVQHLKHIRVIRHQEVANAILAIDRRHFALPDCENAYKDESLPLGFNATLSAPHMHGLGLDILFEVLPKSGAKILDIGSGSGYMTACFAQLGGPTCKVFGVEHVNDLVAVARQNVAKCPNGAALLQQIEFKCGDGFQGWEEHGPFDVIYFGAAAPEVPKEVLKQLKPGGRMLLPVGDRTLFHTLTQVDAAKDSDKAVAKSLGVVRFTPLTDLDDQLSGAHGGGRSNVASIDGGKQVIILPHVVPAPDATPQELEILRSVSVKGDPKPSGKLNLIPKSADEIKATTAAAVAPE